jgi:SAM-dependent methyltransferase
MAVAASRARAAPAREACPACDGDRARPERSAFPDALLACPACGHRWVADAARRVPGAAFYDELHGKGLINPLADDERRALLDERLRLIERWAGPGRVLDVGCGDGAFLARAEARGWSAFGLETSPEAAALARTAVRGEVVCAPLEEAQAALPADCDAVTFWDCLEHLVDPAGALAHVRARLRPGGVVALTMPNAAGAEARLWGPRWAYLDLARYGHLHHFTPRSLRRLVERAMAPRRVDVRTHGSVDLRYVPALAAISRRPGGTWALDRASGLLARVGAPLRLGSTLLLRAQVDGGPRGG